MSINGGVPIDVTTYFDPGAPINPGDSTWWFQTGFTFTASCFSGGFNDIIVWPEKIYTGGGSGGGGSGGGWKGDSIRKAVIFVPSSPIKSPEASGSTVTGSGVTSTADGDLIHGEVGTYSAPPKTIEEKKGTTVMYSCSIMDANPRSSIPFATVLLYSIDRNCELIPLDAAAPEIAVTLFPNPASGSVSLSCPEDEPVSVLLFDKTGTVSTLIHSGFDRMDISALRPGVYYVRTTHSSGKVTSEQLVIE